MKPYYFLFSLISTLLVHQVDGQNINGKVTDEQGVALTGVNVIIMGTNTGTITGLDGSYALQANSPGDTLQFSYLGFLDLVVPIDQRTQIDVRLTPYISELDEVVITALGIARDKKALGFATQEIDGQSLTQARETNFLNSLSGRFAGVNVTSASAGIGGSSRIVIRGETSLAGDNQPLFVVDGVPINNTITSSSQSGQGIDYGNGAAEINPDNIESINVLKGPNAAALYGSRAANGVIIITTKSGKNQKGFGISVNSTTSFESPLKLPDYQNEYGQGRGAVYNIGDGGRSWGPRMDGQRIRVPDQSQWPPASGEGIEVDWVPYPDNVKEFYQTGRTLNNSIAISTGNDLGDIRLSYANLDQTGIVPNTDLQRHNVSLNSGVNIGDFLRINAILNYVKTDSDQRPVIGYGNESVVYTWLWEGRQVRTEEMEDYWVDGLEGLQPFTYNFRFNDNPYYTVFENLNPQDKDRLFGNINLNFQFTPELSLLLRTGLDYFAEERENIRTFGSRAFPNGAYRQDRITYEERNTDFLLTYQKSNQTDWGYKVSLGANRLDLTNNFLSSRANELTIPGIYNLGNSRIPVDIDQFDSRKRVNSIYGFAEVSYKDMIYLELTGRNDWSSTLPEDNNSYFYPSASLSLLLSEMIDLAPNSSLSFAKLRVGWAEVGNDTDPYNLRNVFNYGTPFGSIQTATESSTIANSTLRPESINTYEVGLDVRFFNGRLGLDVAYYDIRSRDQIINIPIDIVSGYTGRFLNAGEIQSTGLEVMLRATPFRSSNGFNWETNLNWSANRSEVVELGEGIETYQLNSRYIQVLAKKGGRMGDIYGQYYDRVPSGPLEGQIIHVNGLAQTTDDVRKLGNYNPDWTMGFYNRFSFRGLALDVLFDWRQGGEVFSRTLNIGAQAGQLAESLPGRENGIVGEGAQLNGDNQYVPNDVNVTAERYWGGGSIYRRSNVESSLLDASFVKLRELKLSYNIPNRIWGDTPFRNVTVSFVGRNLFLWDNIPHIDPETNALSGGSILPGVEDLQVPSTRSYGLNINFNL